MGPGGCWQRAGLGNQLQAWAQGDSLLPFMLVGMPEPRVTVAGEDLSTHYVPQPFTCDAQGHIVSSDFPFQSG